MMRIVIFLVLIFMSTQAVAQKNVVTDLKIQGNTKLKTSFIKLISEVKPGVVLDSAAIEQDIIRLKRLPAVSHAYYQVFRSHGNEYNVFYNVEENFTINPQLHIYTTNDDEFAFRAGLYEFNLLGRNIAFGGFYQRDIFDSYGINLRAPFLFNNHIGLAFNYQDLKHKSQFS